MDVGLSKGCGNGEVQVLEILADGQQVVRLQEGREPQVLKGQQQQQQEAPQLLQQQHAALGSPQRDGQQQQIQQQQQGEKGSWFPESLRALLQGQSEAVGLQQGGKQQGGSSAARCEPTPA